MKRIRKIKQNPQIQAKAPSKSLLHTFKPAWFHKDPQEATLIFLDIESTGGNAQNAAIIEIAAVKYCQGKEVGRFESLVDPKRSIPPIVQEITGITNEMVKGAPSIRDVLKFFMDFAQDGIFISHGAISDTAFIVEAAEKFLHKKINNYYLCTHLLIENLFPEIPQKSLSKAAAYFQIPIKNIHRAASDADLTAQLFWKMIQHLEKNGISTIEDLLKSQGDMATLKRLGVGLQEERIESTVAPVPGVYFLFNNRREICYLSASSNVRKSLIDLTQFSDDKEFNRILVETSDFRMERHFHLLDSLIHESRHLRRLNLPIDPRRYQKRNLHQIQILIPQDLLSYMSSINHPWVQHLIFEESSYHEHEENHESKEDEENLENKTETPLHKITTAPRLASLIRSGKHHMNRLPLASQHVYSGFLRHGVGWYFYVEDTKNIESKIQNIYDELKIEDSSLSAKIRLLALEEFINHLYSNFKTDHKIKIIKEMLHLFKSYDKPWRTLEPLTHTQLPKTGLALISNPDHKDIDLYTVIQGQICKHQSLPPEESARISSPRFFTRLFNSHHFTLTHPHFPIAFHEASCASMELFEYWIQNKSGEGEFVHFEDLKDLYQDHIS